jgi:hypothetical protein
MKEKLKDFANWLWNNDRLRINTQIEGLRNSDEIVDMYLKSTSKEKKQSKLIRKIARWKVHIDRSRIYISYIQLFLVAVVVLKQFENGFTNFVFKYPYFALPVLFFAFLGCSVVVGYLESKTGLKNEEMRHYSENNPVIMEILKHLKKEAK